MQKRGKYKEYYGKITILMIKIHQIDKNGLLNCAITKINYI